MEIRNRGGKRSGACSDSRMGQFASCLTVLQPLSSNIDNDSSRCIFGGISSIQSNP